ncbi:MAG: TIGR02594 family protein [Thermodesulfovibrionia bacterium]|nr:TIGR02594 family protein [Thermodesulfovibrionia bacterium]
MKITAFDLAQRFVRVKEVPGKMDNPQIVAMLRLDAMWPEGDEVPWCSAFVNYIAWLLRLPRSKSLRARSWLEVGTLVPFFEEARADWDVVIMQRGKGEQPGPEVIKAPGHVGFFAGWRKDYIQILGGNQSDGVNISEYSVEKVLSVRRLYNEDMRSGVVL